MGMVFGVFIYVVINYLLVKGDVLFFKNCLNELFYKFIVVILGVVIIVVVMIWDN